MIGIKLIYKWHVNVKTLRNILEEHSPNLVITAGAGDVYKLIPTIKSTLI